MALRFRKKVFCEVDFLRELYCKIDEDNPTNETIPFEEKNYCKYLEEVVKCKLTIRGYSKSLLNSLNKLAKSVYAINGKKAKNK